MAVELKNAADRYELLEKENQVKSADLNKALKCGQGDADRNQGCAGGASTGQKNRGWKPLPIADEVFGSEVCSPGSMLESYRLVCGLGEEYG